MPTRRRAHLAVLVAALTAVVGCTGEPGSTTPGTESLPAVDRVEPVSSDVWRPLAQSPLRPRHGALGAWTGEEMLVVGGTTARPCPPGADCYERRDKDRSDGAAYDPATDSWRLLPDAPRRFAAGELGPIAAWSGREMVVVTDRTTLGYDPERNEWRVIGPAPHDEFHQAIRTDAGIVYGTYDKLSRQRRGPDWLLDPESGDWSRLPGDPFGESYDRSFAWDGERLWLLSMSVDNHIGAWRGAPSRVAVLDGDRWRVVGTTPRFTYGQRWWWFQDRLVVPGPTARSRRAAFLDPGTAEWSSIPRASGGQGCALPPVGPGESWLAGEGSALVSVDPLAVLAVPRCPGIAVPDVVVWGGDELLVWGGTGPGHGGNVDLGLRWTPPDPS